MSTRSSVGVRELRQNLSVYLDRIKQGESLLVTERRQVVAVLRPADAADDRVARLIAEGRATAARSSSGQLPKALKLKIARPLNRILDELRADSF